MNPINQNFDTAAQQEKTGAIVLAAGMGRRMQAYTKGQAKSLIKLNGRPIIVNVLQALHAAGFSQPVVVVGAQAQAIQDAVAQAALPLQVRWVELADADMPALSLRQGLRALHAEVETVVACLADMPLLNSAALQRVLAAYDQRPQGKALLLPYRQPSSHAPESFGHPVVLSRLAKQALAGAEPPISGAQWRKLHAQQVHCWPTDEPVYHFDLDTPSDIAALQAMGLDVRI